MSRSRISFPLAIAFIVDVVLATSAMAVVPQETNANSNSPLLNKKIQETVVIAFRSTHDGFSSDEVILNDKLHQAFLAKCRSVLSDVSDETFSWTLLNLRKAGKLKTKSTRRNQVDIEPVSHIAEIVARSTTDRFRVSLDRIMTTPKMRREFDRVALQVDPDVNLYAVRRAAFALRKTRRLQPELISRIVDWGRIIETHSAAAILADPEIVPEHPGIYIFRDRTGYLYIGQSDNLRDRLRVHLDESHSLSLANYLKEQGAEKITIEIHSFSPDSRAKETRVRRAYESELIASRKPRFNIQP